MSDKNIKLAPDADPHGIPVRVNRDNGIPIYVQLKEQIRLLIHQGHLAPRDILPTVNEMSIGLQINKNTVIRVYRDLCREGLLVVERGRGTFVAETTSNSMSGKELNQLNRQTDVLVATAHRLGVQPGELFQLIESRWDCQ